MRQGLSGGSCGCLAPGPAGDKELPGTLRSLWPGTLVLNCAGAGLAARAKDIADGRSDVVTVGAMAPANPGLVERVRSGAPLNTPDPACITSSSCPGCRASREPAPITARTVITTNPLEKLPVELTMKRTGTSAPAGTDRRTDRPKTRIGARLGVLGPHVDDPLPAGLPGSLPRALRATPSGLAVDPRPADPGPRNQRTADRP